ncbi:hypothetical protein C1645_833259 [Glomus cerebriforme]|uniref:F-box domain-containing protein n=1 Tax=Glomus cerebriforme TaxID=658196 RepID=A0A397SBX2_9GLOM|nr:hypothetical protein C1645_833259 [Glomus cerebriforme]
MPCQIPTDCLNEIFEYLDDEKTLYSLLFVNRLCCKISIRILWRNIWNFDYIIYEPLQRKGSAILSTLVACLPDESKKLLLDNGIFISTPTSKPPLFNYPAFCKVLSINKIRQIIISILGETSNTSILNEKDRNYLVINEVIKMFITQISSLKKLIIYNNKTSTIKPNEISFTYFSGAIDCLTDLSELHCSSDLPSEFFYQLSKICHNLHSLTVILQNWVTNNLKELISLQINLKDLKLLVSHVHVWTNMIPTLTKHSSTLKKIHIYNGYNNDLFSFTNNFDLPISFVGLFSNLQEIKFSSNISISVENIERFKEFEKLQYVTFPKLQCLKIPHNCTKLEYIMKFLENNGKRLKKFYIGGNDRALNLSIAKFCPNLKIFLQLLKMANWIL